LRPDHRINPFCGGRSESLSLAAAHRINALWISASPGQENGGQKNKTLPDHVLLSVRHFPV
jgi:hypothetical protein